MKINYVINNQLISGIFVTKALMLKKGLFALISILVIFNVVS